jgi:molybdopterin-guanine dinucleotide biosynthesis protein A
MLEATAVILAGGKSSRMGYDKQLLKLNGRLVIEAQINMLSKLFQEVVVVTNRPELYKDCCVTASDILENFGPLGGIHAGLIKANNKLCYIIACDMPNINEAYIKHILQVANDEPDACQAVVTCFGSWLEPFNAIYSKDIIPIIEQSYVEKSIKIGDMLAKARTYYIKEEIARIYSPDWSMFDNINTQADLVKLE